MAEIFVLVEHRQGLIRDITYELLTCGRKIAEHKGSRLTAVLLGYETDKYIEKLRSEAHKIIVVDSELYKDFNAETYQLTLSELIKQRTPLLTIIGHTAFGYDLCPALATQLGVPFTTDCLDLDFVDKGVQVTRQLFDGKLDAHVLLREHPSHMVTVRSGCSVAEAGALNAEIEKVESVLTEQPDYRKFVEYIEAAIGEVDITRADILVSVGRGVKEQANIQLIEEFAQSIGGVVACSRPVVDAGWLPKERQVGSSGKTVKPKLYLALGISGAFQHIVGMKNADTIIAVNKDPNAPIFSEADYGIVEDLFKVIPVLKNKILEKKQAKG
jgi:electron transfer flavoprotein alpha subunit